MSTGTFASAALCKICILPSDFPGAAFDKTGTCQYCVSAAREVRKDPQALRAEAEARVLGACAKAGKYKIAVAFSGGKDSSFALSYLRGLIGDGILAVTLDNGYLSPTARKNCEKVTTALGVEHLFLRPDPQNMAEVYRASVENEVHSKASLMRASSICNSCIRVIDTQLLNLAAARKIPVVAWGYIESQAAIPGGLIEHELAATLPFRRDFVRRMGPHVSGEALRLLEPSFGSLEKILFFCPLVYLDASESRIFPELAALGWEQPCDTGEFSSNCRLNEFAIDRHKASTGLHPYLFKTASLVRRGLLPRGEALRRLSSAPPQEELEKIAESLSTGRKAPSA